MRAICTGISIAVVLMLVARPTRAADQPQQDRQLDWVKRLTAEFFELALAPETDDEYATSIKAFLSSELSAGLDAKPPEAALPKMAFQYQGGAFKLKTAEMAPNGSEVVLTGELIPSVTRADPAKAKEDDEKAGGDAALLKLFTGIDLGTRQSKPADVTIRVAKDTDGGRWQIRFVRVKLRVNEKSK